MRSASRALIGLLAVVLAASLAHAGYTNDGYESNGYQGNGYGSNGFESNGYESNGYRATDTGSPSLDAVLSSLLFGNPQVRDAFLNLPFTAYHLTNDGAGLGPAEALTRARQHALYQVWSDPDSQKLLAYLWAAAHAFHDDLDHDPCLVAGTGSCPVKFWGRLGLCDRGTPAAPRGAAVDQPLVQDVKCQHWLSAVFLAQNNQLGYRDLIGLNGPTSTPDTAGTSFVGNQLTWQSEHVTAFRYVKDSKNAVDAVTRAYMRTTIPLRREGCATGCRRLAPMRTFSVQASAAPTCGPWFRSTVRAAERSTSSGRSTTAATCITWRRRSRSIPSRRPARTPRTRPTSSSARTSRRTSRSEEHTS